MLQESNFFWFLKFLPRIIKRFLKLLCQSFLKFQWTSEQIKKKKTWLYILPQKYRTPICDFRHCLLYLFHFLWGCSTFLELCSTICANVPLWIGPLGLAFKNESLQIFVLLLDHIQIKQNFQIKQNLLYCPRINSYNILLSRDALSSWY